MTASEWLTWFAQIAKALNSPEVKDTSGLFLFVAVIIITILQVSKAKYNPWTWFFRKLGKALNGEVSKEIGEMKKDLAGLKDSISDIEKQRELDNVFRARRNILTAADEVRRGVPHSEEFFNEILADIDVYQDYCSTHPRFENAKAETSIALLKEIHYSVVKDNKFV